MTPHDHALELVALALEDLYMARSTAADPHAPDRGIGYHLILPEYARELGFLTRYAVAERYTVRPSEALERPKLLALVEQLREWIEGELLSP